QMLMAQTTISVRQDGGGDVVSLTGQRDLSGNGHRRSADPRQRFADHSCRQRRGTDPSGQ
ncbi:MAG: hypothetical protein VX528_14105, partial [Candidatus Latescibacterota bacterium]|nr:hypothetical protein [Candidatus Latescibacterota bacterium]